MSKQAFPAFDGGAALRDLAEAFTAFSVSQRARLIAVSSPQAGSLIAERFVGREALSEPYAFDIDCLSNDAYLDIGALLGEPVTLRLLLADGTSTRTWHGLITEASQLGADGALARYRLRSEPWLALLGHRRTSRIFQDKTIEEILGEVFAYYPAARFSFRLNAALQPRSLCVQYRETDLAFVQRLLASEGLSYSFEHDQDTAGEDGGTRDEQPHTQHELVIFDAREPVPVCAQAEIRYHRANATEASDSIQAWRLRQTVTSNAVTLASWDYKQLVATHAEAELDAEPLGGLGDVPALEDYAGDGAYRFPNGERAEHVTDHHAADHALQAQRFLAEGTVRQLAPFTRFSLLQHGLLEGGASDFTVLSVRHEAANNLSMGVEQARLPGDLENGSYRNQAECVAAAQTIVPRPLAKPRMPGLQTAIVVGTQDATARLGTSSDRDHRVKVQFPWQRGGTPLSEAMAREDERATHDETNGTWLRVASMLAGPNWGGAFVPRVGSEVLVDFIDGDPDRPLVVAQLYNGEDAPPWPAGEDSGANHGGAVSGIHAPTLDGTGWSQWQIDDTQGQSRSRVATSFAASQLELGHLISHGPTGGQRGTWRGEGFELRTAGWSVARAPKGLLLSGSARASATSTQMDAQQAAGQLKGAAQLVQHLTDAAAQSKAKPPARTDVLDQFAQRIQPEPPPADGTDATDRALKPFEAPALLMEAPASIALTTPHSTTVFAGQHLVASVQEDLHLAAQHTASFIAAKIKSLYTHAGGITAISANDPLSLRAHDDKLEVLADQSVTLTSSSDEVHVLAQSKIALQAGQSSVTLEGGNITFACPGNFTVKGASKALTAGGSGSAEFPFLPSGSMGTTVSSLLSPQPKEEPNWIEIDHKDAERQPMAGQRYKIFFEGGAVIAGALDAKGHARHDGVPPKGLRVEYEPREPEPEKPWDALQKAVDAARSKLA
ncbi:type VI secretion system Vgr family protein [Niveibacterium sp. SC-1]|uniref:type VI secretion system Vgr family protein n=1 Tax=Niveibacterium sp. SC-1 TaxID=3135646 RepID=UPI00311D854E